MSKSQLYLGMIIAFLIVLGLPAFMLPESPAGRSQGPRDSISRNSPKKLPDTELILRETTDQRRREIRHDWKLNINKASAEKLQNLPGVGPNLAENIVNYRRESDGYYRKSDLTRVSGIGSETLGEFRDKIKIGQDVSDQKRNRDSTRIDINSASREQLQTIDGIGPVTAERVMQYRKKHGDIRTRADLLKITGIGPKTAKVILRKVEELPGGTDSTTGSKIDVNTANRNELRTLRGIGEVLAGRIIDYRDQHGGFSELSELQRVDGIGPATVDTIKETAVAR
ncbi:MAG: ComEA family DNA-binding protein [bacterium]